MHTSRLLNEIMPFLVYLQKEKEIQALNFADRPGALAKMPENKSSLPGVHMTSVAFRAHGLTKLFYYQRFSTNICFLYENR